MKAIYDRVAKPDNRQMEAEFLDLTTKPAILVGTPYLIRKDLIEHIRHSTHKIFKQSFQGHVSHISKLFGDCADSC